MTESQAVHLIHSPKCLTKIRMIYPNLRLSESKIAEYILKHPDKIIYLSISNFASLCKVNGSAVTRFCQKIGYKGYPQLKISLAKDLRDPLQQFVEEINLNDNISEIKKKVLKTEIRSLNDTADSLSDEELKRAIEAIMEAGSVSFYGMGASGIVAQDANTKFSRIGIASRAFSDYHFQKSFAALLKKKDVAIGISYSGKTKETIDILSIAKKNGATTICVTNYANSNITKVSDIKLYTAAREGFLRIAAMGSRIAQLAVIDILLLSVAIRRYEQTLECIEKTRENV